MRDSTDRLDSMRHHTSLRERVLEVVIVGTALVLLAAFLAGGA